MAVLTEFANRETGSKVLVSFLGENNTSFFTRSSALHPVSHPRSLRQYALGSVVKKQQKSLAVGLVNALVTIANRLYKSCYRLIQSLRLPYIFCTYKEQSTLRSNVSA